MWYAISFLLFIYFVFRWRRNFVKYENAKNAIMAKIVISRMSQDDAQEIISKAFADVAFSTDAIFAEGIFGAKKGRSKEAYAILAITMFHSGIQPPLKGEHWANIRNPIATLVGSEKQIKNAAYDLKRKHGITADINSYT